MNLLYIDDDEVDRLLIRRYASQTDGIACDFAPDLESARELLAQKSYQIILCDYAIGPDTLEPLLPAPESTIFILYSGIREEDIPWEVSAQINTFIPKPLSWEAWLDLLGLVPTQVRQNQIPQEVYTAFLDLAEAEGLQIEALAQRQEWVLVGRIAHKLKPNLNLLGFPELADLAQVLEAQSARPLRDQRLADLALRFKDGLRQATEQIKSAIHAETNTDPFRNTF